MLDRNVLRWGGMAAMVGAVLGLVFNAIHPRALGESFGDRALDEVQLVGHTDNWEFIHFMLLWTLAFVLVALIAIGWSYSTQPAQTWARIATGVGLISLAIGLVTIAVDGMATSNAAHATFVENSPDTLATAVAVTNISAAMFTATVATLFGLTPVLFGVTGLTTDQYPKWLGWVALVSGALGLVTASIQFFTGITPLTSYLFIAASFPFTVWLFVMGWRLWGGREAAPAAQPATTTVTP